MRRFVEATFVTLSVVGCATNGNRVVANRNDEACASYPYSPAALLAEREGFGAQTTGGDPSKVYMVTSFQDSGPGTLREALQSAEPYWIVFKQDGRIVLNDEIKVKSNKTVDGRGRKIVIDGLFSIKPGTQNVIFSDLSLTYPRGFDTSDGDVISIRGNALGGKPEDYDTKNFWFNRLELSKGGDGLLDIRGGTNVTISWSHFHSHAKAMLHQKDTEGRKSRGMRVTFHHNFFDRITRRSPLFYYGLADLYNNYQYNWYEFAVEARADAKLLSQENIYEARPGTYCWGGCPDPSSPTHDSDFRVSKRAIVTQEGEDYSRGYVNSVNDLTLNGAQIMTYRPENVFRREEFYRARIERASIGLAQKIASEAGPRADYCR